MMCSLALAWEQLARQGPSSDVLPKPREVLSPGVFRCPPWPWHSLGRITHQPSLSWKGLSPDVLPGYCHRVSYQICSLALPQTLSSRRFLFLQNDVILFNGSHTRCNSWPWQAFLVVGSLARCTPWYTGSQGGSLARCTVSRVEFFYVRCALCVAFVLPTAAAARERRDARMEKTAFSVIFIQSFLPNPQLSTTLLHMFL